MMHFYKSFPANNESMREHRLIWMAPEKTPPPSPEDVKKLEQYVQSIADTVEAGGTESLRNKIVDSFISDAEFDANEIHNLHQTIQNRLLRDPNTPFDKDEIVKIADALPLENESLLDFAVRLKFLSQSQIIAAAKNAARNESRSEQQASPSDARPEAVREPTEKELLQKVFDAEQKSKQYSEKRMQIMDEYGGSGPAAARARIRRGSQKQMFAHIKAARAEMGNPSEQYWKARREWEAKTGYNYFEYKMRAHGFEPGVPVHYNRPQAPRNRAELFDRNLDREKMRSDPVYIQQKEARLRSEDRFGMAPGSLIPTYRSAATAGFNLRMINEGRPDLMDMNGISVYKDNTKDQKEAAYYARFQQPRPAEGTYIPVSFQSNSPEASAPYLNPDGTQNTMMMPHELGKKMREERALNMLLPQLVGDFANRLTDAQRKTFGSVLINEWKLGEVRAPHGYSHNETTGELTLWRQRIDNRWQVYKIDADGRKNVLSDQKSPPVFDDATDTTFTSYKTMAQKRETTAERDAEESAMETANQSPEQSPDALQQQLNALAGDLKVSGITTRFQSDLPKVVGAIPTIKQAIETLEPDEYDVVKGNAIRIVDHPFEKAGYHGAFEISIAGNDVALMQKWIRNQIASKQKAEEAASKRAEADRKLTDAMKSEIERINADASKSESGTEADKKLADELRKEVGKDAASTTAIKLTEKLEEMNEHEQGVWKEVSGRWKELVRASAEGKDVASFIASLKGMYDNFMTPAQQTFMKKSLRQASKEGKTTEGQAMKAIEGTDDVLTIVYPSGLRITLGKEGAMQVEQLPRPKPVPEKKAEPAKAPAAKVVPKNTQPSITKPLTPKPATNSAASSKPVTKPAPSPAAKSSQRKPAATPATPAAPKQSATAPAVKPLMKKSDTVSKSAKKIEKETKNASTEAKEEYHLRPALHVRQTADLKKGEILPITEGVSVVSKYDGTFELHIDEKIWNSGFVSPIATHTNKLTVSYSTEPDGRKVYSFLGALPGEIGEVRIENDQLLVEGERIKKRVSIQQSNVTPKDTAASDRDLAATLRKSMSPNSPSTIKPAATNEAPARSVAEADRNLADILKKEIAEAGEKPASDSADADKKLAEELKKDIGK